MTGPAAPAVECTEGPRLPADGCPRYEALARDFGDTYMAARAAARAVEAAQLLAQQAEERFAEARAALAEHEAQAGIPACGRVTP